jgi:hypothetical protein
MALNSAQAEELFTLLQNREATLQKIRDREEEERGEVLSKVYTMLLGEGFGAG